MERAKRGEKSEDISEVGTVSRQKAKTTDGGESAAIASTATTTTSHEDKDQRLFLSSFSSSIKAIRFHRHRLQ